MMVVRGRVELPRPFERQNLNLVRLPIPPSDHIKRITRGALTGKFHKSCTKTSIYTPKLLNYNNAMLEPKSNVSSAKRVNKRKNKANEEKLRREVVVRGWESFTKVLQSDSPSLSFVFPDRHKLADFILDRAMVRRRPSLHAEWVDAYNLAGLSLAGILKIQHFKIKNTGLGICWRNTRCLPSAAVSADASHEKGVR